MFGKRGAAKRVLRRREEREVKLSRREEGVS